jgi:hypothetical protein
MSVAHRMQYFADGGGAMDGKAPGVNMTGTAYAPVGGGEPRPRGAAKGGVGAEPGGVGDVRGVACGKGAAGGFAPSWGRV